MVLQSKILRLRFSTILLLLFLVGCNLFTEPDAMEENGWTFVHSDENYNVGMKMSKTRDGGFILLGITTTSLGNFNEQNLLVIKTDSKGQKEWIHKCYILYGNRPIAIYQTTDGGFLVTGTSEATDNREDISIYKLSRNGEFQWHNYLNKHEKSIRGYSIIETDDFGHIIVGELFQNTIYNGESDVLLIKVDANGNIEWEKTYGDSVNSETARTILKGDMGYTIIATKSDYPLYGRTNNIWMINVDSNGDSLESFLYADRYCVSGTRTSDGGFVTIDKTTDGFNLIKFNNNYEIVWNNSYNLCCSEFAIPFTQTSDGGFVVTGYTFSLNAKEQDILLLKLDASGSEEWKKIYGGEKWDRGYSCLQDDDGGFVLTGYTNNEPIEAQQNLNDFDSDIILMKKHIQ